MSRKKKFLLNSLSGLLKQFVVLVCGFVMTKAILNCYGSLVNGLISSITQFLSFITFLEMGIGPVIQSNLYQPLAEEDKESISRIVIFSEKFFRRIAYIFIVYIVVLCFIYPQIINSRFPSVYTVSLILVISISSFAQYYFGMAYQLLLNADQKGYVQTTLQWVTLLANTILCIILMRFGVSVHIVKLATAIIYVFRPIFLCIYVDRHYKINRLVTYKNDPIKQKWNGFAQHLSAVVVDNTDIAVLSIMSTLQNISIYTVYFNVVYGVTQIVLTTVNGLEAMWGNMLAKGEGVALKESFVFTEWLLHTIVTAIFTACALLIVPFVVVYTKGISDADYNQPLFGILLVLAFAMQCYRIPYFRLIKAAGNYKETQNGALISMILNILISVVLVKKFGLIGVAAGTFAALLFHTFYFVRYLSKRIMNRSIVFFLKHLLVDFLVVVLSVFFIHLYMGTADGYLAWGIMAVKVMASITVISLFINRIFYHREMSEMITKVRKQY